jgi:hypothetical protein
MGRPLPLSVAAVLFTSIVAVNLALTQQATHAPGQPLQAVCGPEGRWVNVQTSDTTISADCVEAIVVEPPPSGERIVVGAAEVGLFPQVPQSLVRDLRVMQVNNSVGGNISDGIGCLATATAQSLNACRRWCWSDGASYCSPPLTWAASPLLAWQSYGWPGFAGQTTLPCADTSSKLACFESFVNTTIGSWDVYAIHPSYTDAGTAELSGPAYTALIETLKARYPAQWFVVQTASLPRAQTVDDGMTARLETFNQHVRTYVASATGKVALLDIAQIEQTDPAGGLHVGALSGLPVIAPHYSSELNGGHLGYPSSGKIRIAMAWHVVLARIAGWAP